LSGWRWRMNVTVALFRFAGMKIIAKN